MDEQLAVTCCFTGHRPEKLPWGMNEADERCAALKWELAARLDGIYEAGYRRFFCGMALGCDMYFAEAVLALRKKHPDVSLEAAIPCLDQADNWPADQQRRYRELLSQVNRVSFLQASYSPGCMQRRNRYMVDRASLLLACYDGRPGGTRDTLLYAMRNERSVILINIP